MGTSKIPVKLANPDGNFIDDSGLPFVPHETRLVEASDRIKNAIAIRVLIKDQDYVAPEEPKSKPAAKAEEEKK